MDVWIAGIVFVITYAVIATDRIDKTVAALLGGLTMVVLGVIDQEVAFHAVDLDVIFLLVGMMALAGVLGHTGFFQVVAIRAAKLARGRPFPLMVILAIVTAVLSAFLDNVTTVVLLAPVTLYVANILRISPFPFLITEIFASNVGGTATLIGDPPNILIGSAAGLDFGEFLVNLAPVAILVFAVLLGFIRVVFGRSVFVSDDVRDAVLALDEREVVSDPRLLRVALVVVILTIGGFLVHDVVGVEAPTVALLGATVLLLVGRLEVGPVLRDVEWPTLFFFVGLFMLVSGVVEVGIIEGLARELLVVTGGDAAVTTIGVLWLSGVASGIVDNIPYTATMIPLVQEIGRQGVPIEPLWWSLALGADFGGNATLIGASANVVVANLAARAGHPISFRRFLLLGIPITALSLVVSTAYLWVRYLT